MAKRAYKYADESALLQVDIPEDTRTYKAVSNEVALRAIRNGLSQIGMTPRDQEFKLSNNGQIATGRIFLGDPEEGIQRCLGWINSYDKSKPFGIACGANVFICSNGMFTSEIVTLRKHTKNVMDDLNSMIQKALRYLESSFKDAITLKKYFERVKLERNAINEIIGQLYLEEEIITNYQLSIIKDGLQNSDVFNLRAEPTMWNLYNVITESFKRSHASSFLEDHVDLNNYMMRKAHEWELPNIPTLYSLDVEFEPEPAPNPVPALAPMEEKEPVVTSTDNDAVIF